MKTSPWIKLIAVGASLPLLAGCVEREIVYRPGPPPPGGMIAAEPPAPPPAQYEVVTAAPGSPNVWFWVRGCWEWRGRWVWFPGHWARRPHPGAVWSAPHWGWRGNVRVWVHGDWR